MTDLERFLELYKSVGIEVKLCNLNDEDVQWCIEIAPHRSPTKVGGYAGFFTDILFDQDGKFIRQNFWE